MNARPRPLMKTCRAAVAAGLAVTSLTACNRSRAAAPAGDPAGDIAALDSVAVRLIAEDTSWHASYIVPAASGRTTEVPTGREVHVPLGADVRLALTSRTYISDFTLPELGLRDFAAPDLPSDFRFRADRAGRYRVRGDELCGLPHTDRTLGWLVVEDAARYRAWVRARARRSAP